MSEALKKAHEARAAKRAAGIPLVRLDPIEKAKANPTSKALAIKAKCCECVGGPEERGWQKVITNCTGWGCPLHPVRPYQQAAGESDSDHQKGDKED